MLRFEDLPSRFIKVRTNDSDSNSLRRKFPQTGRGKGAFPCSLPVSPYEECSTLNGCHCTCKAKNALGAANTLTQWDTPTHTGKVCDRLR